jgi:hypothetical protein
VANLKLSITKTDDPNLAISGDVWVQNAPDDAQPLVTNVIARASAGSRFVLDHGKYTFRFNVDAGTGKFTLQVERADGSATIATRPYDTADAVRGRTLRFEVT